MKSILILLALTPFYLSEMECNKRIINTPACVEKKIDEIKAQPKWNPAAEVNEYLYNNQRVYLFSSDCCDQYITLYDSDCNYICAPSGGITGSGDGKCADFNSKATFVRQVWKDPR